MLKLLFYVLWGTALFSSAPPNAACNFTPPPPPLFLKYPSFLPLCKISAYSPAHSSLSIVIQQIDLGTRLGRALPSPLVNQTTTSRILVELVKNVLWFFHACGVSIIGNGKNKLLPSWWWVHSSMETFFNTDQQSKCYLSLGHNQQF